MADDWDDWGDGDDEAAAADGGDNSSSDKSEGWDWPVAATTTKPPAPICTAVPKQQSPEDESSAVEREAREAVVEEMTEKFFVELRSYLENLADPSVREEINQVRLRACIGKLAHSSSTAVVAGGCRWNSLLDDAAAGRITWSYNEQIIGGCESPRNLVGCITYYRLPLFLRDV